MWEGRATDIGRHAPGLGMGPSLRGEAKFQSGVVWIPVTVGHCRLHEEAELGKGWSDFVVSVILWQEARKIL